MHILRQIKVVSEMSWWPVDNINWASWIRIYDKYIVRCKGCDKEIYSVPELKPICDKCHDEGYRCGCSK